MLALVGRNEGIVGGVRRRVSPQVGRALRVRVHLDLAGVIIAVRAVAGGDIAVLVADAEGQVTRRSHAQRVGERVRVVQRHIGRGVGGYELVLADRRQRNSEGIYQRGGRDGGRAHQRVPDVDIGLGIVRRDIELQGIGLDQLPAGIRGDRGGSRVYAAESGGARGREAHLDRRGSGGGVLVAVLQHHAHRGGGGEAEREIRVLYGRAGHQPAGQVGEHHVVRLVGLHGIGGDRHQPAFGLYGVHRQLVRGLGDQCVYQVEAGGSLAHRHAGVARLGCEAGLARGGEAHVAKRGRIHLEGHAEGTAVHRHAQRAHRGRVAVMVLYGHQEVL